jgi:hypothetical protein
MRNYFKMNAYVDFNLRKNNIIIIQHKIFNFNKIYLKFKKYFT